MEAYDASLSAFPVPPAALDLSTDYGQVRVYRFGPPAGKALVLLHGSGANALMWYRQVTELARDRSVYAVDILDEPGRSEPGRAIDTSHDNAAWMDQTLSGLGLDEAHLVGASYGGWLALNQAIYGSSRLTAVTLIDPGGLERIRPAFIATMVAGGVAALFPRRTRPWFARKLASQALVEPPLLMKPVLLAARGFRPPRPLARPFTDNELRQVTVPLQVLLAGRSTMLHPAAAAARVRRLVPAASVEIVPGVGHAMGLEQPHLVNGRILAFHAHHVAAATDR